MASGERIRIFQETGTDKTSPTQYWIIAKPDGKTVDIKSFGWIPFMRVPLVRTDVAMQEVHLDAINRTVTVVRNAQGTIYQIGNAGTLSWDGQIAKFTTWQGLVYQAEIPDESAHDRVFSGLIGIGVDMAEISGMKPISDISSAS